MMIWKEQWFASYEQLLNDALAEGFDDTEAQVIAEEGASSHAYERAAGAADNARKAAKENA